MNSADFNRDLRIGFNVIDLRIGFNEVKYLQILIATSGFLVGGEMFE